MLKTMLPYMLINTITAAFLSSKTLFFVLIDVKLLLGTNRYPQSYPCVIFLSSWTALKSETRILLLGNFLSYREFLTVIFRSLL
jgi:hypothetical protein